MITHGRPLIMSIGSLDKFARLAGARTGPPKWLYNDHWPGRTRRALQIASSLISWLTARGDVLVLKGKRLPAASGNVEACRQVSLSALAQGAVILRRASLDHLANELRIDSEKLSRIYLADADVLVILATRGGSPVVIHIADDQARGERYQHGCEWARQVFSSSGNEHLIPHIIDYRKHPAGWILTQERLSGRVISAGSLSADALIAHVSAAIDVLPLPVSNRPECGNARMESKSHELTSLLENELLRPGVLESVSRIAAWLDSMQRETAMAHGDYWFSNVLFSDDALTPKPRVTGIVDWERASPDAPVGEDALFFTVFAFAHWRGCSPMTVFCMIWDGVQEPTLERMLELVRTRFKLSPNDLGHLSIYLWLNHLLRHAGSASGWTEKRTQEWLRQPSQCARNWIETTLLNDH